MVLEFMNAGTLQDLINAGIRVTERMIASVARRYERASEASELFEHPQGQPHVIYELHAFRCRRRVATQWPLKKKTSKSLIPPLSVLLGLHDVHNSKQIHRDIKPSNILLSRDGNIKISDFGIARKLEHSISMASTFTGTLTYMSPERISGESYDAKCDVWSLGVCLCTLAKGEYPFTTNEGYWGVVQAIQENDTPKVGSEFGEDFQDFLDVCLQKDPKMRGSCR